MGACCATDSDGAQELRTTEDKGLLVIEFGDSTAHWSDIYPSADQLANLKDANLKLNGIDSKHVKGYTPLSGIRLNFDDGSSSPWMQTSLKDVPADDIEEVSLDIYNEREIREISMRISTVGNAICALEFSDDLGATIFEIEWENFDLNREWKTFPVPAGYTIVGIKANTTNEPNNITRLGFVLSKVEI